MTSPPLRGSLPRSSLWAPSIGSNHYELTERLA